MTRAQQGDPVTAPTRRQRAKVELWESIADYVAAHVASDGSHVRADVRPAIARLEKLLDVFDALDLAEDHLRDFAKHCRECGWHHIAEELERPLARIREVAP